MPDTYENVLIFNVLEHLSNIEIPLKEIHRILKINGKLIFEIGDTQKEYTIKLLKNNGMYINKIIKDLSGKDRCIVSTKLNK